MKAIASILILTGLAGVSFAQKKDTTESGSKVSRAEPAAKCANLLPGKVETMPAPKFPAEARTAKIGGAVEVTVRIDAAGRVAEIEKIDGNQALHGAAIEAAMKARFSPTLCDGRPTAITGVLSYNFIPLAPNERYFSPATIDGFKDIAKGSLYYEAILDLTDNYKIAFGYGDRNYYPDLPMSRGDLAHQLRLTLDFLQKQAAAAKVDPRNGFRDLNPKRIKATDRIEFADPKAAYVESMTILLRTYNVSLFDEKNEFDGRSAVRRGELILTWRLLFGDDSIPVNFEEPETESRVLSRGEFALFLQESLRVLIYKLLPVAQ